MLKVINLSDLSLTSEIKLEHINNHFGKCMKIRNNHERTFLLLAVLWGMATAGSPLASARMSRGFECELPYFAGEATVEVVAEAGEIPKYRREQPQMLGGPEWVHEPVVNRYRGGGAAQSASSSPASRAEERELNEASQLSAAMAASLAQRKQQAALTTYQAEVKQAIDEWTKQGSIKATLKAYWNAPTTTPKVLETGLNIAPLGDVALAYMGLKGVSLGADTALLGFCQIWKFLDGLVGIENHSISINNQLKQNLNQSATKYWETVNGK